MRPYRRSISADELMGLALASPGIAQEVGECIEALEAHGLAKGHSGQLTLTKIVESDRTRRMILEGTLTSEGGWGETPDRWNLTARIQADYERLEREEARDGKREGDHQGSAGLVGLLAEGS